MSLAVLPNPDSAPYTQISITMPLPSLCPVSRNPQEGSSITITYIANRYLLEVYSIMAYLKTFTNGKQDGDTFIREMEQTIQVIAQHAAAVLLADVEVVAHVVLQHGQTMTIAVKA